MVPKGLNNPSEGESLQSLQIIRVETIAECFDLAPWE